MSTPAVLHFKYISDLLDLGELLDDRAQVSVPVVTTAAPPLDAVPNVEDLLADLFGSAPPSVPVSISPGGKSTDTFDLNSLL